MISVTVFVDSEHQYESIRMLGHAGLADDHQEGQELVCAAVSALVLNMANSIEQFTDDSFEADQDEEAGGFNFRFTDHISPESRLLMNSLGIRFTEYRGRIWRAIYKNPIRGGVSYV